MSVEAENGGVSRLENRVGDGFGERLIERPRSRTAKPGPKRRAELALIAGYLRALRTSSGASQSRRVRGLLAWQPGDEDASSSEALAIRASTGRQS